MKAAMRRGMKLFGATLGVLIAVTGLASPATAAHTRAPDTKITSAPSGVVTSASAKISFRASIPKASFQCRLDGSAWKACRSPKPYAGLTNGPHTFAVRAVAKKVVDRSPASARWTVAVASPNDPRIAAGGDIACAPNSPDFNGGTGTGSQCMQNATSQVIAAIPGLQYLLPLGDEQYQCGELANFNASYEPSWGRFKSISRPVPGNHEYGVDAPCPSVTDASGYFSYFGSVAGDPTKGYYSYDVGMWHIVALNSNCVVIACSAGSPQETWLKSDLTMHPTQCTLAYWHAPRWSVGQVGDEFKYDAFWRDLYNAHVELVLNGHDHTYQRFTQMNPAGTSDPNGIREVIVGTGGDDLMATLGTRSTLQVANATTFGVLQLVLHPAGYDAVFLPIAGGTFTDSFSGSCH
jgi:hypothetical protein